MFPKQRLSKIPKIFKIKNILSVYSLSINNQVGYRDCKKQKVTIR